MRKLISIILIAMLSIALISCKEESSSNNENTDSKSTENTATENKDSTKKQTELKFTVDSVTREDIKGDRTQDNVSSENGECFAIGSKIVKASDYEYIVASVKIENTSDKAANLNKMGFTAEKEDGYQFSGIILDIDTQISSKSSVSGKIKIPVERKYNVNKLKLEYVGDIPQGLVQDSKTLSEDEIKEKYKDFYDNIIEINLEL